VGAGVGPVVDLGEALEIEMGIDLGRRDVGVTEQFLNGPKVATRFEQMARTGMPEAVWKQRRRQAPPSAPEGDTLLDGAS